MLRIALALTVAGSLILAQPAGAQGQGKGRGKKDDDRASYRVPPGHLPPAGRCRVWIDGVPPGQQPAVTDCTTAERNRVRNSRVLYGDDYAVTGKGRSKKGKDGVRSDDGVFGRDRDDDRDSSAGDVFGRGRSRPRADTACVDANRDGRCDFTRTDYPRTLPEMAGAILIGRNERTADVSGWLGNSAVRPRYEAGRNRVPSRVTWVDGAGRVVQIWTDANQDGRADRVDVYRNGRLLGIVR